MEFQVRKVFIHSFLVHFGKNAFESMCCSNTNEPKCNFKQEFPWCVCSWPNGWSCLKKNNDHRSRITLPPTFRSPHLFVVVIHCTSLFCACWAADHRATCLLWLPVCFTCVLLTFTFVCRLQYVLLSFFVSLQWSLFYCHRFTPSVWFVWLFDVCLSI